MADSTKKHKSRSLKDRTKLKLRLVILMFLFALLIPSLVLINQAYRQLKWETFHQHQTLAGELVLRINKQFNERILIEEARGFTDYSFIQVEGELSSNYVQRSPLSAYPVEQSLPGLLGYFQVDAQGRFTTPLLPEYSEGASRFGISRSQIQQRDVLQNQIRHILNNNNLLPETNDTQNAEEFVQSELNEQDPALAEIDAAPENGDRATSGRAEFDHSQLYHSKEANDKKKLADYRQQQKASIPQKLDAQSAFDRLDQSTDDPFARKKSKSMNKLGRVEDLDLGSKYTAKNLEQKKQDYVAKTQKIQPRVARKEQGALPEAGYYGLSDNSGFEGNSLRPQAQMSQRALAPELSQEETEFMVRDELLEAETPSASTSGLGSAPAESGRFYLGRSDATSADISRFDALESGSGGAEDESLEKSLTLPLSPNINLFESEIDPFEFRLLDSGHFLLYRKVWRNGERIIQGILLEQKALLNSLIQTAFNESTVSEMSKLIVAYQGNVLSAYSGTASRGFISSTKQLQGDVLYRTTLSAPFSDLELIFTIKHLPAGQGGVVVAWAGIILTIVLFVGLFFIYRAGARQIELVEQQQDFVSSVSHELKTPLTSIRMYGEILKEGWASEEKKREYYHFIFDESERLSRLISNVLQLARVNHNDLVVDLRPSSVGELMDMVRSKISTQVEAAGYQLNLDVLQNASDVVIEVDADCFSQIIINLVDNALKFSAKADVKKIDINAQLQSNGFVQFTVRDYGPGVPKNQLKKIFQLFFRSEAEMTRETVGTGIGLALVQNLALAMNGDVDVVNQQPGVAFHVSFPVKNRI
ncbi:HAMP domain-containing sensor histidine kinase [Litoribacillus peritrichatus]|uniref:histidine kinase n=1 Tax=Litoribacillus peritrichatus TaxID=718191 RepID=A0ABP7M7S1_9GAMM